MNKIPPPRIHVGGTSFGELQKKQLAAVEALRAAIAAVSMAQPHSRDYDPIGPDAYPEAHKAHGAALNSVCEAFDVMMALAVDTSNSAPRKEVA